MFCIIHSTVLGSFLLVRATRSTVSGNQAPVKIAKEQHHLNVNRCFVDRKPLDTAISVVDQRVLIVASQQSTMVKLC